MSTLSAEEAELWARVAATIRPLSREPARQVTSPQKPEQQRQAPPPRSAPRPPQVQRPVPLNRTTLDGSWDKRLRSGAVEPDRILDLHGRNLDQAWRAIDHGLESAIGRKERVVLLITGHARSGDPPIERGKIRAAVHDWLAASRHANRIAAVRPAHRRHGGGGSLYIVLRR